MQKRMEEEEEARLGLEEKYSSLQEEVEGKGRKLKKLWTKYKAAQSEIRDVQAEFSREKEDILETVRELSAALRLRDQQLADCTQRLEAAQQNAEDLAVRAQFGNYAPRAILTVAAHARRHGCATAPSSRPSCTPR